MVNKKVGHGLTTPYRIQKGLSSIHTR